MNTKLAVTVGICGLGPLGPPIALLRGPGLQSLLCASWHSEEAKPGANVQTGMGSCLHREDREVQRHHLWHLKGERRRNNERDRERDGGKEREPHKETTIHL